MQVLPVLPTVKTKTIRLLVAALQRETEPPIRPFHRQNTQPSGWGGSDFVSRLAGSGAVYSVVKKTHAKYGG